MKTKSWKISVNILGTKSDIKVNLFLDENKIEKSQEVALPGITIDDKLNFNENICRKAKYKLTRYNA